MLLTGLRAAFRQRHLYAVGGAVGAGALATAWLVGTHLLDFVTPACCSLHAL